MSPEQYDKLKTYTTFILRKRAKENEPVFDQLLLSTEKLSSELTGESTQWDMTDHKQEVDKLQGYAEDLAATGEIIIGRKGWVGEQLI